MGKLSMSEVVHSAPPVAATEALRRSLLHEMYAGITKEDIGEVRAAIVEKAKAKDINAARLLWEMLSRKQPEEPDASPGFSFTQINLAGVRLKDVRESVVRLIGAAGPLSVEDISTTLGLPLQRAAKAVQHPRYFQLKGGCYHITSLARESVLGDTGGQKRVG